MSDDRGGALGLIGWGQNAARRLMAVLCPKNWHRSGSN